MSARLAIIDREGRAAYCYSCRTMLALRGARLQLAPGLVQRPDTKDGMARFGPTRRDGLKRHPARPLLTSYNLGNPAAFYANCPNCDRGQIVQWG